MGKQKHLVVGQPNYNDTSQYNFDDNETSNFSYENSTGLPKNRDKFVKKDLYTTTVGDSVNNAIIAENLKFEGLPFIRIDSLRIANAGHDYGIRGIKIEGWMCSKSIYNPSIQSYDNLSMPGGTKFFSYSPGDVSAGSDLGNLSFLEGENIVENFATTAEGDIIVPSFTNSTTLNPAVAFSKESPDAAELMKIIDEVTQNPIFIVIKMTAEADRYYGSDKCERKFTTFKLDNLQFFENSGGGVAGTSVLFSFKDIPSNSVQGGGGSGGGSVSPRFKVSDISVTISTLPGIINSDTLSDEGKDAVEDVLPPSRWSGGDGDLSQFLNLSPSRQLNNNENSGTGNGTNIMFPDYFVKTEIGMINSNRFSQYVGELSPNYIDCQSYYEGTEEFIPPSAPTTITFNPLPVMPTPDLNVNVNGVYFYFVIDWDDSENKINNLNDFLRFRPNNVNDLLELQQENLYILREKTISNVPLTNTYTTPGIKNLKFIIFSENSGEVGRWKLVSSRFFLDVPYNQYPLFEDLAGSNYTTIPWPYTTALIGGISEDSKYKISIQDTISSGNITNSDIIDEKLLINDIENNEMGQNILSFDLEQIRFFDKPYGINELLKIPTTYPTDTSEEYLSTLPFPQYLEEFHIFREIDDESPDNWAPANWQGWIDVGRPDIAAYMEYASSANNPFPDEYTYPDYIYDVQLWFVDIPIGDGAEQEVSVFFNPTLGQPYYENFYNDTNYWDGDTPETTFPEESSVGQIFIGDNLDVDLKQNCILELNTGNLTGKSIYDSSGNSNKGLLFGDYKVKKQKGSSMIRDSFIKVPKKTDNSGGAL